MVVLSIRFSLVIAALVAQSSGVDDQRCETNYDCNGFKCESGNCLCPIDYSEPFCTSESECDLHNPCDNGWKCDRSSYPFTCVDPSPATSADPSPTVTMDTTENCLEKCGSGTTGMIALSVSLHLSLFGMISLI